MEKLQLNVREIPKSRFHLFLGYMHREFEPSKVKPTEDGHFIVYYYNEGKDRFNVCYDVLAQCVQATAEESVLERIRGYIDLARAADLPSADPAPVASDENKQPDRKEKKERARREAPKKDAVKEAKKTSDVADGRKAKPVGKKRELPAGTKVEASAEENACAAYKDGYALNRYDSSRLEQGIEALRRDAAVASVKTDESQAGTAQHFIKYTIVGKDGSKATVQYALNRKVVQIQGKPSGLTDLVQNVLSGKASESEIVKARVDYNKTREKRANPVNKEKKEASVSGTTAGAIKKQMTKSMPHGVLYLSKQSQTYLYYALIDLNSNLSNYGGILATAYQGLENLIANLQQAQGIKVKMIGQAYEKPDGKYVLKAAYRKRVKSIVFCEVMSALYTEYFEKRHYYTHSDNYSDVARVIGDQATAKSELARLIEIIEYNCTKLSEIGFHISGAVVD